MKESNFQFTNPSLTYIRFLENETFIREQGKNIELETNIRVDMKRIDDSKATVSILIKIGEEEERMPFVLETKFSANFRWDNKVSTDQVELFLNQNAPALLLSYARPVISMITNESRYPAYHLPFINFADIDKKDV